MPRGSQTEANAWLTHLVGSASEHAVVFLDASGRVVAWMGAAERLFGYSKTEALGLEFGSLFTPEDRRLQVDLQELAVARAIGRSEDERWHVRKDGSLFWASGVVAAVKFPDGEVNAFCKVLRDRTDLRQRLDTLQNRVQALQQENERKGRLLESLSHQLQSLAGPLKIASGALEELPVARADNRQIPARAKQMAAMSALLEKAAEAEEAASLAPPSVPTSYVLQGALEDAIGSLRQAALAAGQNLQLTLPSVAIRVKADPVALSEMLESLIANSLSRTPSGGHVHVTATVEDACAVVRVTDDGSGISGKRLWRIFLLLTGSPQQPIVEETETAIAVVKELAAKHGGSLEARSSGNGKGSVFSLRLPSVSNDAPSPQTDVQDSLSGNPVEEQVVGHRYAARTIKEGNRPRRSTRSPR